MWTNRLRDAFLKSSYYDEWMIIVAERNRRDQERQQKRLELIEAETARRRALVLTFKEWLLTDHNISDLNTIPLKDRSKYINLWDVKRGAAVIIGPDPFGNLLLKRKD